MGLEEGTLGCLGYPEIEWGFISPWVGLEGGLWVGFAAYQLTINKQAKSISGCLEARSWVLERLSTGVEASQGACGGLWCTPHVALVPSW